MIFRSIFFLAAFFLSVASCTKEGPIGPQGEQGEQGERGAQGEQGEQGEQGNANVRAALAVVLSAEWTWSASSALWSYNYSWSEITEAVAETGAVMVYVAASSGAFVAMPATYYPSANLAATYGFNHSTGQVQFTWQRSDRAQSSGPGDQVFKVVVIPRAAREANPDVDLNDYEAVVAAYNVK